MMKFLRSQSQMVLIIVLGVIGLGFLFYGSSGALLTGGGGHANNDYGRINGEDLSVAELSAAIRNTRDAIRIGPRPEQLAQPGASAQVAEEAWRQLLLLREADRLHIEVSDKELIDYIHRQPLFQKDGVYSPEEYQARMSDMQNALHISPDTFESIMRNTLRVNAVSTALFSTVHTSAGDVSAQYEKFYGSATVSLVSFDPKTFIDKAQVTPEAIEAEYKAHPTNPAYRTKEKRKVDYVLFLLSPDQAKLPEAEKTAAKQALGEKALDFALAFQPEPSAGTGGGTPPPPDFGAEAKKRGLAPVPTDFFAADTPPANVPPSPSFNAAAFSLTQDNPISKVVELDNGVAILHLVEIQPSDLRPLEEVKSGIVKQLQQDQGLQSEQASAQLAADALKAAVAKGADFKTAAAGLNFKVETLPAFVPTKVPPTDQRLQTIAYAVTTLAPGQVSDPVPVQADNTTLVLHLDARASADPAGLADFENRFRQSQDQQLRALVYIDWANWRTRQTGTHKPPELDAYGGVE